MRGVETQFPAFRRRGLLLLGGAVLVIVLAVVGSLLVLRESGGEQADRPDGVAGAEASECELLMPRGLEPSRWFTATGSSRLTTVEAGPIAAVFGTWSSFNPDDDGRRVVADLLDRSVGGGPVEPLSEPERRALADLDVEFGDLCS